MILACLMQDIVFGHDQGREYKELVVDRNEIPDPEEAEDLDVRIYLAEAVELLLAEEPGDKKPLDLLS